jgi:hypothetical protein
VANSVLFIISPRAAEPLWLRALTKTGTVPVGGEITAT